MAIKPTTNARRQRQHRFIVPEVVQTSAMDCGPASLKCLLDGFNIRVSYGRLREACQTDVDGTSIDTLEEVAKQLGLEAEQVVVPADHVLLAEAKLLPALAVTRLSNGNTHFVVIWGRYGNLVQVMNPAQGRVWKIAQQLLDELYVHSLPVGVDEWREYAASDEFIVVLRQRLANLGLDKVTSEKLLETAFADTTWHSLAALDASARMVENLASSQAVKRGSEANRLLNSFFERSCQESPETENPLVPASYWSVRLLPSAPVQEGESEEPQLLLRGAVLVRIRGKQTTASDRENSAETSGQLSPELMAAIHERPNRPTLELLRLLKADGLLAPTVFVVALLFSTVGIVVEGLLFQVLLNIGSSLTDNVQRLAALAAFIIF